LCYKDFMQQETPWCSCIGKAGDIKLRGKGGRLNPMVIMTICSVEDGLAAIGSTEDSCATN